MFTFTIIISLWVFCSYSYCDTMYELDIRGTSEHGYYITVNVGSPPQELNLLPDTGSSNLAIAVTPLDGENSYFRFNESLTFVKLNADVDIHYVDGQWNGFLASDFINLKTQGGFPVKCTIACITNNNKVFDTNSKFSGLLGLAYSSIANPNSSVTPLLDVMVKRLNMSNIFAFSLCGPYFSNDEYETTCGKLHLGYISKEHFIGEIAYTPIVKEWFYEVILVNFKVGSKQISDNCKEFNNPRTIIDTGTTRLHLPEALYHKTVQLIKKSVEQSIPDKFWHNETVACIPKLYFNMSDFPTVILSFYHTKNSSFDITVSPDLYLLPLKASSDKYICYNLGFAISDVGTIIGSTILKGFYVIFDRFNKQIGFANSTKNQNYLVSVSNPNYVSEDIDACKNVNYSNNDSISVGTIIWLIIALGTAIWLLFMLIIWIRGYLIERSEFHSETSSLVDD